MDLLKKLFPLSFNCQEKDNFIKALIVYIVAMVICSVLGMLLGGIPVLGILIDVVGYLVGLYSTAGIVFSILVFVKVFK